MYQTTVLLIIAIVFISITWIRKIYLHFVNVIFRWKRYLFWGFPDNSPLVFIPLYFLLVEHLLLLTTGQDGFCNVTLSTGQNISTLCHVNNNQWTVMFLFDFLQKKKWYLDDCLIGFFFDYEYFFSKWKLKVNCITILLGKNSLYSRFKEAP